MLVRAARTGLAFLTFIVSGICVVPSAAQTADTRAAETARQQEEKARALAPYRRNWFERQLLEIEQAGGFTVARGFYVSMGDIKSGSGIAMGPAYGKTFGNGALVAVKGAYSVRNFKLAQLFAQSAPLAAGRLTFNGRVRWQDAPELAVYPLGPDSPKTRADYAETKTEVSGQALMRPARFLRLGAGASFERYETGGSTSRRSSVEELFTPQQMPGIGADPEYLRSFATVALDSLAGPGFSRSGTLLQATLYDYHQQNEGPWSFRRVDGIARQLIPILHGNWVIDLSVRASMTDAKEGNEVPFFLMPDLGGGSDLRGYSNYRFRDRNSILATAEYRWYVQEYVEMALFVDGGKVAARREDLDLTSLKSDVGIGLRFHGPRTTVLRVEAARGREGWRFILGFGPAISQ
jgi:hypothetical protein